MLNTEPIYARLQATSRGPYNFRVAHRSAAIITDFDGNAIATVTSGGDTSPRQANANAEFFTEAKTDVWDLLAEVARLRAKVGVLEKEVARLTTPPAAAPAPRREQLLLPFSLPEDSGFTT